MQQHSHAPLAKSKRGRNLAMLGAFNVGEPHHLPLLRLQLSEGPRHVESQRHVGTHHLGVGGDAIGRVALAPLVTPVVVNEIAGDAKHVRTQLSGVVDRRWCAKQTKVRLLNDVVRGHRAADDAHDVRAERRRGLAVKRLKGRFI